MIIEKEKIPWWGYLVAQPKETLRYAYYIIGLLILAALFLGLVFLLHPLHTEAVAWASARKDVLSALFFLASLIAYLYHRDGGHRKAYGISIVFFLCGLASKVVVVTLPVVLMLLDLARGRRIDRLFWTEKIPYLLLSVVFGVIALFGKTDVSAASTLLQKILLAGKASVFYLRAFFLPTGLSVLYPYTSPITLASPDLALSLAVVALVLVMAFVLRRRAPLAAFGIIFFFLTLSPTFINVAKGGDFYFASDRYAYMPSLGLLLVIGAHFSTRIQRRTESFWMMSGAGVLVVFGLLAMKQSAVWADSESLFAHAAALYPQAHIAQNNLGNAYRRQGRNDEAVAAFRRALDIRPHVKTLSNLGATLRRMGKIAEAERTYERALVLDPESAIAHVGLGLVYAESGRPEDALREYERALTLDPQFAAVYINIGALLQSQGKLDEAAAAFARGIIIDPTLSDAHYNLGVVLMKQGKTAEAIVAYGRAVETDPQSVAARLNLGILLNNTGQRDEAIAQFEAVLRVDPANKAARQALVQIR